MFATCVALQDHLHPGREAAAVGEAASIWPIAGVLQSAVPALGRIFSAAFSPGLGTVVNTELVLTYCRALCSLELAASLSAFRECDILAVVADILSAFAVVPLGFVAGPLKVLLERALGLLCTSISSSRRGLVSPMDSGVSCLYQQYFVTIATQVFQSRFTDNPMLWFCLVELIAAAINAEPAFLSVYLSTEYSKDFLKAIKVDATVKSKEPAVDESPYRCSAGYILFLPLLKLVLAVSITNDGMTFAVESRITQQVLAAVSHSCFLMPQCAGIPSEVLRRIGKYLGQVVRELPVLKRFVHDGARMSLLHSSYEAIEAKEHVSIDSEPALESPRMKALQRLNNICTLVESLGTSEGRRSSSEFLRDTLKEDVVDALFRAFSCSLPLPRQMYAQLTMVQHSGALIHFGHHTSAKAITSLIKLGVGYAQHVVISTAFKCLENTLTTISTQKRSLRSLVGDLASVSSSSTFEVSEDETVGLRKRRGRGSSLGTSSNTNVLVLGVLDCFPDLRLTYDAVKDAMIAVSPDLELACWAFLASLLELEWFSTVLAQCLRTPLRQASPSLVPSYKDSIRRIFAFYRSSMLEICRLNSSTWLPKVSSLCVHHLHLARLISSNYVAACGEQEQARLPRCDRYE
jgi:hypothetical protein